MIIFNIYAIVQAIIGAAVVGLLHLVLGWLGYNYDMIGGSKELFVSLIIISVVSVFSEVRGVKGTLFYIPFWLAAFILSIITFLMFHTPYEYDFEARKMVYVGLLNKQLFIVGSGIFIFTYYIFGSRKHLKKRWELRKHALAGMKVALKDSNPKLFWELAGQAYFKPSLLFLYGQLVWGIIFNKAIDSEDFLSFYRDYMNLIDMEDVPHERHRRWAINLKDYLNNAEHFSDYRHPEFGFSRLANLIQLMQQKYS